MDSAAWATVLCVTQSTAILSKGLKMQILSQLPLRDPHDTGTPRDTLAVSRTV